ncbi:hypothetical protein [Aquibium oceanicum]|uniref:hypothetical protein n=1 Tax=Aquibium oceanicum TaxID=1670800 RepID=UPI000A4AA2F6|nr:hypothetical protein [Aquibium oceanicum]
MEKNEKEMILDGRAMVHRTGPNTYWLCRPDGEQLERFPTRELAEDRGGKLVDKGTL